MNEFDGLTGKEIAAKIATDIAGVQPMNTPQTRQAIEALLNSSKTKKELEADGYKPVSRLGLMWIKDEST